VRQLRHPSSEFETNRPLAAVDPNAKIRHRNRFDFARPLRRGRPSTGPPGASVPFPLVIAKANAKLSLHSEKLRMSLASLLTAEQIIPEMKATERWPAIIELIDLLVTQTRIDPTNRDSILAALKQREETMSTGIGFGIAIPHASSEAVEEVVAAFGRSLEGIEFDALDNAPVRFVVLFIVPKNQFQTHLRTLASIAKFLNDRSVREQLAAAGTRDQILAIFEERAPK